LQSIAQVPTQFIFALGLLIYTVGVSGFAGLATTMLLIPLGKRLVAKLKEIRKLALACTDERLKLTTEALTGIRIVKFMAWEQSLIRKIDAVRTRELGLLRKAAIFKALNFTLLASSPMLICIATLTMFGALGGELTASTAFTAFSLLNLLKQPIEILPRVITDVFVDGRVSLARLSTFLSEPAMVDYMEKMPVDQQRGNLVLHVRNAVFAWQPLPKKLAWCE
jgi:ABC-type bacteriocin/lantibiotic exporter with double-glycine peptidase domain